MEDRSEVYRSSHRPDSTAIKNSLHKQGIGAWTEKSMGGDWLVLVESNQYQRAYAIVWGDAPYV